MMNLTGVLLSRDTRASEPNHMGAKNNCGCKLSTRYSNLLVTCGHAINFYTSGWHMMLGRTDAK